MIIFVGQIIPHLSVIYGLPVRQFAGALITLSRQDWVLFGESLHEIISNEIQKKIDSEVHERIALIGTGELTVTIRGNGIGGRNQEMLLSFLNSIKEQKLFYNLLIIGVNLDGIEGNSKAMGALIDKYVIKQMILKKINPEAYLQDNNSNSFFKKLKSEIISGPTGCNVNDLLLILISR